jgi:hypothetical protein
VDTLSTTTESILGHGTSSEEVGHKMEGILSLISVCLSLSLSLLPGYHDILLYQESRIDLTKHLKPSTKTKSFSLVYAIDEKNMTITQWPENFS